MIANSSLALLVLYCLPWSLNEPAMRLVNSS